MKKIILMTILSLTLPVRGSFGQTPAPRVDLLDLASGSVVLSRSSEFDQSTWSALSLLDSTSKTGWCSAKGAKFPHEMVIELPQTYRLEKILVDNTHAQEGAYPGISARGIDILTSTVSATKGFTKAMTVEAKKGAQSEFPFSKPTEARWIKLSITSNWGHAQFTELMELGATGQPIGTGQNPELAGVYRTNYNLMSFQQEGNRVTGCYEWDGGFLTGSTDGRVVQFEWRENGGTQVGTAIMVLAANGKDLNGLWYEGGALKGIWVGTRAKPGEKPKCAVRGSNSTEKALAESGRAIVYGINFDYDSDKVRPDSEPVLGEILAVLNSQSGIKLLIEGHTSNEGSTAYNQQLSQRRAQAIVTWLVAKGIPNARLTAKGLGESRPVADNTTTQGRSLNRRVEIVQQK